MTWWLEADRRGDTRRKEGIRGQKKARYTRILRTSGEMNLSSEPYEEKMQSEQT